MLLATLFNVYTHWYAGNAIMSMIGIFNEFLAYLDIYLLTF